MNDKETENKNSEHMGETQQEQDWKAKFNELVQSCQNELKRTTQIGMKMLSASQSNAQLRDKYEELGRMAASAVENGDLEWKEPEVAEIIASIKALRETLEGFEKDVADIKKS